MGDKHRDEKPERRGQLPPNPMFKPGETLPLSEILRRIPKADADLLRDVDAALAGRDTAR